MGLRAVLDAVVKRKIPSRRRESNPKKTSIVQPVAQRCFTKVCSGKSNEIIQRAVLSRNRPVLLILRYIFVTFCSYKLLSS